MTDAVGAQVQRKSYAPYGAGLSQATGYHEAKDFIGERLDEETGLLYLNARYYDPVLGRFISADPLLPGVGVNRYAYAGNNPVMYSDPYGLMFGRSPMENRSAEPGLVGDEGFSDHGLGFGSGDRDENWASDQSSESLVEYDYPPEDEDWFITRRPTATAVIVAQTRKRV